MTEDVKAFVRHYTSWTQLPSLRVPMESERGNLSRTVIPAEAGIQTRSLSSPGFPIKSRFLRDGDKVAHWE